MNWSQVRQAYPEQWLVIEALEAHSEENQRKLDRIAVLESCRDGKAASEGYQRFHKEHPFREFYFVHTGRETLDIRERRWIGIRGSHATARATETAQTYSCDAPSSSIPREHAWTNQGATGI